MKEAAIVLDRPLTLEEYIEFEERAEVRHEMIDQQLFPMPGTTYFHNEICFNLKTVLRLVLQNLVCRISVESVKAQITHSRDYAYPDVMVSSNADDLENEYIFKSPSVIFEVISKNSRMADTVDKFILYKKIESLQTYVLVDSEQPIVEVRTKLADGTWEGETFLIAAEKFPVPALGIELAFADVYAGVRFRR